EPQRDRGDDHRRGAAHDHGAALHSRDHERRQARAGDRRQALLALPRAHPQEGRDARQPRGRRQGRGAAHLGARPRDRGRGGKAPCEGGHRVHGPGRDRRLAHRDQRDQPHVHRRDRRADRAQCRDRPGRRAGARQARMKRLEALEGLRGYAAFLVFLVHSCGIVAAAMYGVDADRANLSQVHGPVAALVFFFRSHYGVDLFFVLSGLLMADIAARRWPGTRAFLARRALRIYPAYLASGALALLAGLWIFDHEVTASQLAANAAVLQGFFALGIAPINPVTWSLTYEVAFYLAVPLLALAWGASAPAGRQRAAAWILA